MVIGIIIGWFFHRIWKRIEDSVDLNDTSDIRGLNDSINTMIT